MAILRPFILLFLFSLDLSLLFLIYSALPATQQLKTEARELQAKGGYTPLAQTPKVLQAAVIFLEDDRFYEHRGFDFQQIKDALLDNWRSGKPLRGASTLSQQLVKNLYLSTRRSWIRKFQEALITIKLENTLSKDQILELYLNRIDWGKNTIGIRSGAKHYFQTEPQKLSIYQSIALAAILPNPARFGASIREGNPDLFVRWQMIRTLKRLYRQKKISLTDYQIALQSMP